MRRALQLLALALVLSAGGLWLATGAHRGWTRTSVPVKTVDDVTGIEGISYHPGFVPGVHFLGMAVIGAGALAGVSFLFRNQSKTDKTTAN